MINHYLLRAEINYFGLVDLLMLAATLTSNTEFLSSFMTSQQQGFIPQRYSVYLIE